MFPYFQPLHHNSIDSKLTPTNSSIFQTILLASSRSSIQRNTGTYTKSTLHFSRISSPSRSELSSASPSEKVSSLINRVRLWNTNLYLPMKGYTLTL
ncbi:hypothetical protein BC938DRAFT_475814 [Jimgerdemannia flammicorona]|uniref:Uncharacterized protein n=1 Tax=Jimgerdemannia flammicorona TaxID=994334 RepID=A0A433PNE9_9FUNG|nr:hypothetical protein BC938DRAFT_475814 [Jimgerdemannia flammicorona]